MKSKAESQKQSQHRSNGDPLGDVPAIQPGAGDYATEAIDSAEDPLAGDPPPERINGNPFAPIPLDPFDPKSYTIPADDRLGSTGDSLPGAIHCGRPLADWIFRVHPDPAFRCMVRVYSDRTRSKNGANYLWSPNLAIPSDIEDLVKSTLVAAAITSEGVPFLYLTTESESGWYESAVAIMKEAMTEWRRQKSDTVAGEYVVVPLVCAKPEPVFPDVPFRVCLERAFRKRLITSLEDPIVRRIR